jgi:hypothetical protein
MVYCISRECLIKFGISLAKMVQFLFYVLVPSIFSPVTVRIISCVHHLADGNLILRLIKFLRASAAPFVYITMCSFQAQACALPGGPWRNQRHERWDRETERQDKKAFQDWAMSMRSARGSLKEPRGQRDRETGQEGFSGLSERSARGSLKERETERQDRKAFRD